jgi:hypothetical protein
MTGPEHYRQAERHAREAAETYNETPDFSAWLQRQAQVHATLALAAAQGLSHASDMPEDDFQDWLHATAAAFKGGAS